MQENYKKFLDYKEWRKFNGVIEKAKKACENSDISIFVGVDKLPKRANNADVMINDYKLTRYACYLIVPKRVLVEL